jgi:hypothetical protein
MGVLVFLTIRVLHVAAATLWFGAVVLLSLYLAPTVDAAGPAGGQIMGGMAKRGFLTYMAAIAGLTVVSGLWLYWRFTGGFDPQVIHTHAGLSFGVGGLAGVVAAIIGGSVVGRSAKQLVAIGPRAASLPPGAERDALAATAAGLRARMTSGSRIVTLLVTVAIVLMALGHYI